MRVLAASLPTDAHILWFSWKTALISKYDVVHVHWPEFVLRTTPERVQRMTPSRQRAAKELLLMLWMARLRLRGIPVVRTLHNVAPHETGSAFERARLRWFDVLTVTWIRMNVSTPLPAARRPGRVVTIPHGHYIDWYGSFDRPSRIPGRLLYFGQIRGYKGVPELLAAFSGLDRPSASLRIVGLPMDNELRHEIERAVDADPRITAELSQVDDATLAKEIGAAQVVVLPFRNLLNSGSVLLALSLDRPVLIPGGRVQAELAAEVGPEWVHGFESPLRSEHLDEALRSTANRAGAPDLSARDWAAIGKATYEEYVAAVRNHGRRLDVLKTPSEN